MKRTIVVLAILLFTATAFAQNTYKAVIKDAKTNQVLPGATLKVIGTNIGTKSDSAGIASVGGIPSGKQIIQFSYVGYQTKTDTLTFPLAETNVLTVLLTAAEEDQELEDVVISATRSSRTIDNIPTRVEVIAGEELDEKGNMKPGDIRMMLAESTGIQTQQTSATSGNSSIRIQGLDGKYTQIIRDGFPLYSGFSGGLGLLQIAPLDLQQVEVIKGSSSTLYGG